MGSHGYQEYDGSIKQKVGDRTTLTAAGSYLYTKGYDVEANGNRNTSITLLLCQRSICSRSTTVIGAKIEELGS